MNSRSELVGIERGGRVVIEDHDARLAEWLRARRDERLALHEIGLFERTGKLIAGASLRRCGRRPCRARTSRATECQRKGS
jgi:hypothetical protein